MDTRKHYNIIVVLLCWISISFANPQFPVPKQLEPNVEFWVRIFSLYSKSEVVIHDSNHPKVVYDIVNLNDYFSPETSMRNKWKKINAIIDQYQAILQKLDKMGSVNISTLTNKELEVYLLWLEDESPNKYKNAIQDIRGQRGLKEDFMAGIQRSGKYLPEFKAIFKKYGLPDELVYLPHVESSFANRAYSKYGASGVWQFMRSTGRLYMNINHYEDERLDPFAATDAAARLLKSNYQLLGSWPLAITAYNHGPNGMKRAMNRYKTKDIGVIVENYKSRTFGFASKNFYAEFVAAIRVRQNYQHYFGTLEFEKPDTYTLFKVPETATIKTISQKLGLNSSSILELNPALHKKVVDSSRQLPKDFELRIPELFHYDPYLLYSGVYSKFNNDLDQWVQLNDYSYLLTDLATMTQSSTLVFQLKDVLPENTAFTSIQTKISDPGFYDFINPDHIQESPVPTGKTALMVTDNIIKPEKPKSPRIPAKRSINQSKAIVRNAPDSMFFAYTNTTHLGPELPEAFAENIVVPFEHIKKSLNFEIQNSKWITVLPNETLGHYADWLNVSSRHLRKLNRISYKSSIHVGQKLRIDFVNQSKEDFESKRLEFHDNLQKKFYTDYSIVGTKNYQIKSGDNIWYLCKYKFNVPYWLVAYYNKDLKWNNLKPGDEIQIPIISPYAHTNSSHYRG